MKEIINWYNALWFIRWRTHWCCMYKSSYVLNTQDRNAKERKSEGKNSRKVDKQELSSKDWRKKNHLIYAVNSIPISVHSSTRFWTQFDMAKIEVSPENWLKSTFPQGFTFPILDRNLDFWHVNSIIWCFF